MLIIAETQYGHKWKMNVCTASLLFSKYKTILKYKSVKKIFTFDPKSSKLVIGG